MKIFGFTLLVIFSFTQMAWAVPPIGSYDASQVTKLEGIKEASGLTFNPHDNKLYVITDRESIFVINTDGTPIDGKKQRKIELIGFADTEGITHIATHNDEDIFAILEEGEGANKGEGKGKVTYIVIKSNTTKINKKEAIELNDPRNTATTLNLNGESITLERDLGKDGWEGIAHNPGNGLLVVLEERVEIWNAINPKKPKDLVLRKDLMKSIVPKPSDLSGLHYDKRLGAKSKVIVETLLVLSDESKTLYAIDYAKPNASTTTHFDLANYDFPQPEGVTMDNKGVIYLVSEKSVWIFSKSSRFMTLSPKP